MGDQEEEETSDTNNSIDDELYVNNDQHNLSMERLLQQMVADNRRRDEMFASVLHKLTPIPTLTPTPSANLSIMPEILRNINTFDGNRGQAEDWINKLSSIKILHQVPEEYMIETARTRLSGGAAAWYRGGRESLQTWDDFEREFREMFVPVEDMVTKYKKMIERTQRKGEEISTYFHEKVELCRKLGLEFKEVREQVIVGLWYKDMYAAMLPKNPTNVKELFADLEEYERIDKIRYDAYRTKREPQKPPETAPSQIRPENKEQNENKRLPERDKEGKPLCFKCRRYGHVAKYCKASAADNKPQTRDVNREEKEFMREGAADKIDLGRKYFQEALINGQHIKAYVDQGSKGVTIREEDAKKLRLEYNAIPDLIVFRGFGGGLVKPLGRLTCTIQVDQARAKCQVHVVPDSAQTIPLLVGQPFTEQDHITVIKRGNLIRVLEESEADQETLDDLSTLKIPDLPRKKVELWTEEANVIPMNYVGLITLKTNPPTESELFIEAATQDGGCIANCIVRPDENNQIKLPIVNVTNHDLVIERNTTVIRGQLCEEMETNEINRIEQVTTKDQNDSRITAIMSKILVGDDVTDGEKQNLREMVTEFSQCFALNLTELGCVKEIEMNIELVSDEKISYRPYRMSMTEREQVRNQIVELKEANIIEDSTSEYASPILIVRKPNGEQRICIDYRALNKITKKENYPMALIDDQLQRLEGQKYFSCLDLKAGYYQIPMSEAAQEKTAFITAEGHYQFRRLPFGLANAPAVFQRMLHKVLGPLRFTIVMAYMDDLLIPCRTVEEGLEHLREVFKVLQRAGLTLNPGKCKFFVKSINYLGYEISEGKISPGLAKRNCVANFPAPTTVHQVRQFLGLTSYFRRFIKGYAISATPLTRLLRQDTPWQWSSVEEEAFQFLKEKLVQPPVLALFRPQAPIEVHTDASQLGLAGILLQMQENGKFHPVLYASRQTTREEQKYHSTELETLAAVWVITKFRPYLIGSQFKLITDCNAVRGTFTKKNLIPRIGRWWLKLLEYEFTVEHRAGDRLGHADALSRNPVEPEQETECVTGLSLCAVETAPTTLAVAQRMDKKIRELIEIIEKDDNERSREEKMLIQSYQVQEGQLFKQEAGRELWVVPKTMRSRIVKMNHDDLGHPGRDKVIEKIRDKYWFPRMRNYIKGYIGSCPECIYLKTPTGKKPGLLNSINKIGIPYHTIHMDHLGPFVKSERGNSYVIVSVDGFTKHIMLKPVPDATAVRAKKFLEEIVNIFGPPHRVITDLGTSYTGKIFKQYCRSKQIDHITNATATPRANGQVERVNRYLTPSIAASCKHEEDRDWDQHLGRVQYGINNTVHKATLETPFRLLFNYTPRHYDGSKLDDEFEHQQLSGDIINKRLKAIELIRRDQEQQRQRYNRKRIPGPNYAEGDLVVVRQEAPATGQSRKLVAKYRGPYIITSKLPNDRYRIEDVPGMQQTQKPYKGTCAIDNIKLYQVREDTDLEDYDSENASECITEDEQEVDKLDGDGSTDEVLLGKRCCESDNRETEVTEQVELRPRRQKQIPTKFRDFMLE